MKTTLYKTACTTKTTSQHKPFYQPRLTINQSNDVHEQQANAMADKIMRMPINEQAFFSPKPASGSGLQRKCKDCENEEKLNRKENSSQSVEESSNVSSYISSLSSKGSPLSKETRNFFEPKFSHDFSNVKIHSNSGAAESAQSINALAYTTGNNIVFNKNQFSPETEAGKKLLAHELTHIIQQTSGASSIQKKDEPSSSQTDSNGWENDMESFSKVAAEHYLMFDRNLLSDSIQSIHCSAESAEMRLCTVTTKGGIKISVRWDITTKRVVIKACINDTCLACGYQYSVKDNSAPVFEKIKCWYYSG